MINLYESIFSAPSKTNVNNVIQGTYKENLAKLFNDGIIRKIENHKRADVDKILSHSALENDTLYLGSAGTARRYCNIEFHDLDKISKELPGVKTIHLCYSYIKSKKLIHPLKGDLRTYLYYVHDYNGNNGINNICCKNLQFITSIENQQYTKHIYLVQNMNLELETASTVYVGPCIHLKNINFNCPDILYSLTIKNQYDKKYGLNICENVTGKFNYLGVTIQMYDNDIAEILDNIYDGFDVGKFDELSSDYAATQGYIKSLQRKPNILKLFGLDKIKIAKMGYIQLEYIVNQRRRAIHINI